MVRSGTVWWLRMNPKGKDTAGRPVGVRSLIPPPRARNFGGTDATLSSGPQRLLTLEKSGLPSGACARGSLAGTGRSDAAATRNAIADQPSARKTPNITIQTRSRKCQYIASIFTGP